MLKVILCLTGSTLFMIGLYFVVPNSFPESETSKAFMLSGLSIFVGIYVGATIQYISSRFGKKSKKLLR